MDKWTDGQTDIQTGGKWTDKQTDRPTNRWKMDRHMERWTDRHMERWTVIKTDGHKDRKSLTDRKTVKHIHSWTDCWKDGQTDRWKDGQT